MTWIILLAIWTLIWKMSASWYAAQERQFRWFLCIWFAPTFGVMEICYVFYIRYFFTAGRCPRCRGAARLVVYKVGPLARCEAIGGEKAKEFVKEKGLKIPEY